MDSWDSWNPLIGLSLLALSAALSTWFRDENGRWEGCLWACMAWGYAFWGWALLVDSIPKF